MAMGIDQAGNQRVSIKLPVVCSRIFLAQPLAGQDIDNQAVIDDYAVMLKHGIIRFHRNYPASAYYGIDCFHGVAVYLQMGNSTGPAAWRLSFIQVDQERIT